MLAATLMKQIESPTFAARLCIASGRKVFLAALASDLTVNRLIGRLTTKRHLMGKVLKRIKEIARQQVDTRYENPLDNALAAYIWCLNQVDRSIARIGAEFVLGAPQIWWAREISNRVLQPVTRSSVTATATSTPKRAWTGEILGGLPMMGSVRSNDLVLVSRLLLKARAFKVSPVASFRWTELGHTQSNWSISKLRTPPMFINSRITTSDQQVRWRQ